MIKPLFFLFIALAHITALEYKIDLSRCTATDMDCYIHETCIEGGTYSANQDKLIQFVSGNSNPENCDAIVQFKMLNQKKNKMFIMMQIQGTNLKMDEGIIFQQNSIDLIVCKQEGFDGSHIEFTTELKGEPIFDVKTMFCALTIASKDASKKLDAVFDLVEGKFPSIIYSTDTKQTLAGQTKTMLSKSTYKCDTDYAKSPDTSNDYYEWTAVDVTREHIECSGGTDIFISYKEGNTKIEKNAKKVTCDADSNQYKWTVPAVGEVPDSTEFEIGCSKGKFCNACDPFKPLVCKHAACGKTTEEKKDGCVVRKCDEGKWTKDGVKTMTNPDGVFCKKGSDGTPKWHSHENDGKPEVPPETMTCLSKDRCKNDAESGFVLKCPEDVKGCIEAMVHLDTQTINCTQGVLYEGPEGEGVPSKEALCLSSGQWSVSGNLYCAPPKEPAAEEKVGTGGMSGGTIAAIIGVIVVVGVIGGLVYFFVVKPRMAKKTSKAAGPSKKGAKSSKKSTESKSGAKKPSDSDPPEKASGKEGGVTPDGVTPGGNTPGPTPVTDLEKIKTEPSGPKTPEVAAAPGGAPGAPPPPPAAPAPGQSAV